MKLETQIKRIEMPWGGMRLVILRPKKQKKPLPGILWLHGGGYFEGSAEMVFVSRGHDAAKKYGAVMVSPDYRLSGDAPYPAAVDDCYAALKWMDANRDGLNVDRIMVGGESAGGGLTAAVCMMARDRGEVKISYQMPLYPMLDCDDTPSSKNNNNAIFWSTKKNHQAWKLYLGELWGREDIPPYASPAKQTDYTNLPPCYTFVAKGEPFLCETLDYVKKLNEAGVEATCDVFPEKVHAFDAVFPFKKASRAARRSFLEHFKKQLKHGG